MSYHVGVHCHTCGEALNHASTSLPNGLKGLFNELGCPLDEWNNAIGVTLLPRIQSAVRALRDDLDIGDLKRRYDADDPAWSRVDFALPFLEAIRDAICRDPYATVSLT